MSILRFRRSIMLLCKGFIMVAVVCPFLYVFQIQYSVVAFHIKGDLVVVFIYAFLYFVFLQAYGGFKIGNLRLRELVFSNALAVFLVDFIIYFVMSLNIYKLLPVLPLMLCFIAQALFAVPLYTLSLRIYQRLYPPEAAIMIRTEDFRDILSCDEFITKNTRYHVERVLTDIDNVKLSEVLSGYSVVIIGAIRPELRTALMAFCFEMDKQLFIIPTMEDIMLNNAVQYMAEDFLTYRCRNRAFAPDQLAIKRLLDIFLSTLLLLILSPIMFVTTIAIKLQDGGPVFFKQKRLTRGRKEFMLVKFRSMIIDAEKNTGAVRAEKADPRVTPVGRLIRSCRIDELPQLWNVLNGDMSMVGPRPERPELFQEVCAQFPQFAYRLKVKAGITGYAQLYGKYSTTFEDKVRLDLLYIEHASLLQDIQLLFYTIKIVFMKESASGVEKKKDRGVPL